MYVGDHGVVVGGDQHRDLVATGDEGLGQVTHVELHPAGHVVGVRADDAHPERPHGLGQAHRGASPSVAAYRAGSRSSTKTFCSMCQSCGLRRMPGAELVDPGLRQHADLVGPRHAFRDRDRLVEVDDDAPRRPGRPAPRTGAAARSR